ncbi:hypothetical protein HMPREF3145_08115 [Corynebacterium sp. HMSC05C01]|uniref:hypothetical protein n=1 Tax=Corynebacterium sp. HMSC05C01 TaxID=1581113 RepID=UPI0008A30664|nr:hypothetical protein [Corynebacterium sp. HMSC05C01]OFT68840.1 hypothetical protein HMPREF3145_08115 [Corynebacterium sp. HMSC05C01]
MKFRRLAAVALAASVAIGAGAPVAEAATYPEPLNQVLNEMRALGGPLAPNLLLVPAALSSVGWIITILSITSVLGLGTIAASTV